jgi:hypothetical protein
MVHADIKIWYGFSIILKRKQLIKHSVMKKMLLAVAFIVALGSFATQLEPVKPTIGLQEKAYKKIETTAVPMPVLKEISDKYPGYVVSEAYAAEDGSDFRLVVTKDTNSQTVYYTASGEFVKEEKKK